MTIKILILIAYVAVFLGIGVLGMRKTRNVGDFFLGGRQIGLWLSAFSYATTYFSAVVFIGFAGKLGWGFGLNVLWIAAGNAIIGSLLAWAILARPTRRVPSAPRVPRATIPTPTTTRAAPRRWSSAWRTCRSPAAPRPIPKAAIQQEVDVDP